MTIACLANEEIWVTRFEAGRLVGGKLEANKKMPFKIAAGVQAISGRDRETLPEGRRQSHVVKVYTETKLLTSDDNVAQRADLLKIEGEDYEVFQVAQFKGLDMDHWRSFAARLDA